MTSILESDDFPDGMDDRLAFHDWIDALRVREPHEPVVRDCADLACGECGSCRHEAAADAAWDRAKEARAGWAA